VRAASFTTAKSCSAYCSRDSAMATSSGCTIGNRAARRQLGKSLTRPSPVAEKPD
jgi:hypothetical protein